MKTLAKTLTWRSIGTADILFWSWFATGKLSYAAGFAAVHFTYKAALYYGHEVAWTKLWSSS